MRLGISYWGFCEEFNDSVVSKTPDGHRYGRPLFVKELKKKNHKVISLQEKRELNNSLCDMHDSVGFPDIDLLFIEWRWPTYKNSGNNPQENDLIRQQSLLNHYHGKIPIVIWDCDYKLTYEDEIAWPKAIIADPALNPRFLSRKRDRLLFWTDWNPIIHNPQKLNVYGYIGNNYERPKQFLEYYSAPASGLRHFGVQVSVHGNWLEKSPERESPIELVKNHQYISFGERLSFQDSMRKLSTFLCSTHITKDEYALRGFVSPRYLENIACNTLAFVPQEFLENTLLGKKFVVRSRHDIVEEVRLLLELKEDDLNSLLAEQKFALQQRNIFSVSSVVEYIESLV